MSTTVTSRLEGLVASLAQKAPCVLKTTANHALSGLSAIDGVTPTAGQRILVGSQTDATQNGIYIAASSSWARALDFDGTYDAVGGTQISVILGSTNSNSYWKVDGSSAVSIGTDAITFSPAYIDDSASAAFIASGTGAVTRTAQDKMRDIVSVHDFGATGDGTTNDYAAIAAAITAAGVNGALVFPAGTYKVGDAIAILDGQTWIMEGCTLKNTTDTKHVIRANAKSGWSILGRCFLQGQLTTAATAAECGLYITDGDGYRVEGVTAKKFKGKGIYIDGSTAPSYRSNRGQFVDCATNECTIGIQLDPLVEYMMFANFNAGGNVTAAKIYGGNNTFIGGAIVDNTTGVYLGAGTNHGHGIFVGTSINHNTANNIQAVAVLNGFTFEGCHIYGNGTSTGSIWLNGCKGITIKNGIIDCWIYNDSGTGSGLNVIAGNYFPGDYGVTVNSNNSALGQLYLERNFKSTGMSDLNDPAPTYIEATRATSTQSLTGAATTLIFNNEVADKRACYDPATGIFTAPVDGIYRIEGDFSITAASGLTANSYVAINLNNTTDIASIPIAALSGTVGFGSGALTVTLAATNTIRFKSTITATTPVLAITQSRISIAQIS